MANLLYANENPGEYPNSYYAATVEPGSAFPQLEGEVRADVCVVGGGFSGLSAALHLAKAGYSVALLDAHRVGWGASGRNGGQVGTGQRLGQDDLTKLVGPEDARKLWALSEEAKRLVASLIEEFDIHCDYRPGVMEVNHKPTYARETKEYIELLQNRYDYDAVRYVPQAELREILATKAYYDGAYDSSAGHLHPLRYAIGLERACVREGVSIFERSEVFDIAENEKVMVKTKSGRLTTDYVVLAANGYVGELNKRTANRVMPVNNYIIATEPLGEDLAGELIANNAAVADSKFVVNYYRLSADSRLLFGGRESYRYRFPADIHGYVRKAMLEIYPQLEHTKIDFGWGGVLGVTMNRMPHFEWLSKRMVTIGGYSGHGVALATLGGALAAEAIRGVAERFGLMAKVPTTPFPGGAAMRLPLLALGMAYYSIRDRL